MLIPLAHERMTVQRLPWVTITIIALNFLIFLITWPQAQRDDARVQEVLDDFEEYAYAHPGFLESDCEDCPESRVMEAYQKRFDEVMAQHVFSRFGYVPAAPSALGLLGSIFLHAGWMHLLGNMYFLWLYGCTVEDLWGRPLYAIVYITGGAGAALAHAAFQADSMAPLVGASGAISALTGVFLVRCWDTRIRFFYWFFIAIMGTFYAPAWIMLLIWFFREVFNAFVYADSSSVAFWAHIGGFIYGALFAGVMKLTRVEETYIAPAIDRKTNLIASHPKLASAMQFIERGDYRSAVTDLKVVVREKRDDPDSLRLLAQCCQSLGQPFDAARYLRQELAIHVRKHDNALVVETYAEIMATTPDIAFTPRELSSIASALMSEGSEAQGKEIYEMLLDEAPEPTLRVRAALALADFYLADNKMTKALELVERVAPLVETQPDWKALVDDKRGEVRRKMPAALSTDF